MPANRVARVVLRVRDMKRTRTIITWPLACAIACPLLVTAAAQSPKSWSIALTSTSDVAPHGVQASAVTHNGKRAVRLVGESNETESYAMVAGPSLRDGSIEADIAGRPGQGANEAARGFVGIAFRVRADHSAFECFYLRPTNGRANDQLRRNHSTQYVSHPEFPWPRLRKEAPGVYESYVDLVPSEWTHVRIDFRDRHAELYVHRAPQPVLIVNDLKLEPVAGGVGLFIGTGTEGFFRDLKVTATSP